MNRTRSHAIATASANLEGTCRAVERPNGEAYWTRNGSLAFGYLPAGPLVGREGHIPICLPQGDPEFGEIHVRTVHKAWLDANELSVPMMLAKLLRSTGRIHSTEVDRKFAIETSGYSANVIVVKYRPDFRLFDVITIYDRRCQVDGQYLAPYFAAKERDEIEFFRLEEPPEPRVSQRRARKWHTAKIAVDLVA